MDPYISEIRIMSFGFPPKGWALCNGQILAINQNQALFSLLGTTYGGNGSSTFALPDLQGRLPMHVSNVHSLGQTGGEFTHTLLAQELPAHSHLVSASSSADQTTGAASPTGRVLGGFANLYQPPASLGTLSPQTVTTVGGGQAHENMQPFLTLSFCIALVGIFPSRN